MTAEIAEATPDGVLQHLLTRRHSCRAFTDREVPEGTILRILSLAQHTASWCNAQPWKVHITSGSGTRRLVDAMRSGLSNPSVHDIAPPTEYRAEYGDRRRAAGYALYESLGIRRDDRKARADQMMLNYSFFGAPHVAVITSDSALGAYGYVDCGAYVANFLNAATSLGVATIPQGAPAMYASVLRNTFEISDDRHAVCVIAFGFADSSHSVNQFRTTRAPLEDVVEFVNN